MKKIDFLFIHPSKFMHRPTYCLFPVGIVGLANLLKSEGYTVKGINYGVEMALNKKFNIREYLKDKDYKIVGIDLHWHEHSFSAIEIAKICKEINPKSYVVLGGFTATVFSSEILKEFPQVDFVIKGEAEEPLLKLVKVLFDGGSLKDIPNLSFREDKKIVENPITYYAKTLDNLDFVDIDFFENSKFQFYIKDYFHGISKNRVPTYLIYLSRGCLYDCLSCGGAKSSHNLVFGKERFILRSPHIIVKDIEYLFSKNVKRYLIIGDLVMSGRDYWMELFARLQEKNIKPGFVNDVFQVADEEFIREFSKTVDKKHSQLIFSPLCGSEDVRKLNGKLFTNSELFNCLKICKEERINVDISFQVYLPYETEETFKETVYLTKEMTKYYIPELFRVNCMPVKLDPSCPMRFYPEKFKIKHSLNNFKDYCDYSQDTISKFWSFKNLRYAPSEYRVSLLKMQIKWIVLKLKIFISGFFVPQILKKRLKMIKNIWKR